MSGAFVTGIPEWACCHLERTPPDESPERREICVRCGAVIETRLTRAALERAFDKIRNHPAGSGEGTG